MPLNIPIETPLGCFFGRDCIYLDRASFEDRAARFVLEGEINGNLCTKKRLGEFIPYRLRFFGVLALRVVELDSCDWACESCFDEVRDSDCVRSLGGKATPDYHHFFVQTYDDVFEVVCQNYEFELIDG